MHNNFIPELLKEKIIYFFRYLYAFFLTGIAIFIILSLATFSIADNSFLVKTSNLTTNLMGIVGSYTASFSSTLLDTQLFNCSIFHVLCCDDIA